MNEKQKLYDKQIKNLKKDYKEWAPLNGDSKESKEEQANILLQQMYEKWLQELKKFAPHLLEQKYSNPYYLSIPDGWYDFETRILVVGEEGFGTWGCGKENSEVSADEISKIQNFNKQYLGKQLGYIEMKPNDKKNVSPFWRRFRTIDQYGICAWSNIDKIHLLKESDCKLSDKDRKALHSLPTKILQQEIKILQPTHIIFFGWYGISLKHELPEIFAQLYPAGLGDNSMWYKNVVAFDIDEKSYIFTYHPAWGVRQEGYEEKVSVVFKGTISK